MLCYKQQTSTHRITGGAVDEASGSESWHECEKEGTLIIDGRTTIYLIRHLSCRDRDRGHCILTKKYEKKCLERGGIQ